MKKVLLLSLLLPAYLLADLVSDAQLVNSTKKNNFNDESQNLIASVLFSYSSYNLTKFKSFIDERGSIFDLDKLFFNDFKNSELRNNLLGYINSEASTVKFPYAIKTVSSLDDTIFPSVFDKRFPRYYRYPGASAFFYELNKGLFNSLSTQSEFVILSQRADDQNGGIEAKNHAALLKLQLPPATIISLPINSSTTPDALTAQKLSAIGRMVAIYPEYAYLYIGNNVQKDSDFAEQFKQKFGVRLVSAFLQQVVPESLEKQARVSRAGINYFNTYVKAAEYAYNYHMITKEAAQRIVTSAYYEFSLTPFESGAQAASYKALMDKDYSDFIKSLQIIRLMPWSITNYKDTQKNKKKN